MSVKTILYVENDLVSQTMYQKRLECEGFHVECARDGQVAIDILSERVPDLVLLDLMLPRVSGADVLNFMHADPRLTTVPVIIFSNAPMTEVPPDSPLAQSAKRLLKSDCTFPTLLGTIQETLAHPPELVVVEAGKTPPPPGAPANSGNQRNGADTIPKSDPETEAAAAKQRAEFLKEAAAMIPKIREHSMGYIKAPGSEASQTHLSGLHQRVHLLNSSAAQAGCPRVALLTGAFDALLSGIMDKPSTVTPSVLQTIAQAVDSLDSLLRNNDGYSVGPAFQAKVLVVDDDTVCNHVNVTSLKRASFDAVGVKDPAAALDLLKTTSFELVVLDINMPGMTGFDVCEQMRRLPNCKKTPVIFVTAFNNFDNRKQSVLSGGNDFVSKPVSPLELALKVTVNLIKARVQGTGAPPPGMDAAADNGSAGAPPPAALHRTKRSAKTEAQPPEPPGKLTADVGLGSRDAKPAAPSRMARPEFESPPDRVPEPALQAKMPTPANPPSNGKTPEAEIHERLRQSTAALESAKTGLERESAERARLESQWREQLGAAEALVKQTEKILKEKDARCGQLEKELAGLQQVCDELQTKFAAGQLAAAKAQQAARELQERLNQVNTELERSQANLKQLSAERARLETEWRGQLEATKATLGQKETILKEKEARWGQLEKELAGLQQAQSELRSKFAGEQQAAAKSQQAAREFQERLNQANTELERSQAALKQQSEERTRLEAEWREQMSAAKTAIAQAEKTLAEKTTRCGQLETKLVELQQAQDEFQNKLAVEQEKAAKSLKESKELQERLQQGVAELERARAAWEQESAKRAHWESECQNLSKARETLNLELRELRESRAAYEAGVQEKQRKLAEGLRENIQLLQLRLQEAESLNGDSGTGSRVKPRSH
jgi:CheY-like chemotaxis protein